MAMAFGCSTNRRCIWIRVDWCRSAGALVSRAASGRFARAIHPGGGRQRLDYSTRLLGDADRLPAVAHLAADPHKRDLKIAINVSARQFHQPDYVERVREALQESGANPARLQLELTESVVLENVDEVVERMRAIRALGVTFFAR